MSRDEVRISAATLMLKDFHLSKREARVILKRAMAAIAAISAGAIGSLIGLTAPASATSGNGVIETGEFVVWKDSGFNAQLYDAFLSVSNYSGRTFVNSTTGLNDNASSIANYDNNLSVRTHIDANQSGAYISVLPFGQASGSISWAYSGLGGFNDRLSSHEFL